MIHIVINSKGGVGKSTLANQILTAYLFLKNNTKKVQLIEIDDENKDSAIFAKSNILDAKQLTTKQLFEIDEIFLDDDDVIIDVGGNVTATKFLNDIQQIGEFNNIVWYIPVMQGMQDTANALDMYYSIKNIDNNANIIFALSNVYSNVNNLDDLQFEFLHFFGNEFLNTPFAIPKKIPEYKYIAIQHTPVLNYAKTFAKTILDIANNTKDFKELAKQAKKDGNDTQKRKYLFYNRIKNSAINYINTLQDSVFNKLDNYLQT